VLLAHHPHTFLLFIVAMDAFCAFTLLLVAESRRQSKLFAVWGVLGFAGLIAASLIMCAVPGGRRPQAPPPMRPRV
jgi:hypothetical protein